MSKQQDYASDSDESDEDFCPDNLNEAADSGEDDEEESESDGEEEEENEDASAGNKKQTKIANGKNKKDKINIKSKSSEPATNARSTRQTEAKQNGRHTAEKDELESDEEADKSRSDALWADFLGESKAPAAKPKEKLPTSPAKPMEKSKPSSEVVSETLVPKSSSSSSDSSGSSAKENQTAPRGAPKRPAGGGSGGGVGGGLGSLLNQLGKKKKLSVLEKSQQDWKSFKHEEGIDEELRTHNLGKDGYLERQDFLQRTDLRQFEIEKNMRQTRRQN